MATRSHLSLSSEEEGWINAAKANGNVALFLVKDLEDGDIFPVFFRSLDEAEKYQNNIISESKLKVKKTIFF